MKTPDQTQTIKGIPLESYKKLTREYERQNPHSLPGIRLKRRRIVRSELVYTRNQAI